MQRSCSTRTSSPPSTTLSLAEALYPWKRNGWGLRLMPATQPGGGANQQGHDRDTAQVRREAAVNPEVRSGKGSIGAVWKGAAGLAEDVRYYGKWMRDEAERRIGHLYPKVEVTAEMARERPDLKRYVGRKLTVIAWLWARTVKSPNPAFADVDVPLASTFVLSTKKGKEAYVKPVVDNGGYQFTVRAGSPPSTAKNGTKMSKGCQLPVHDIGDSHHCWIHQVRSTGWANGFTTNGNRCGGRPRTSVSSTHRQT